MRSALPKVLHPVCGRPMIGWPVEAARKIGAGRIAAIISPDSGVAGQLPEGVETVTQEVADGTGGAIRAAIDLVRESETVIVLSGDTPLVDARLLEGLLETHREAGAAATIVTCELEDPGQYGRVVRDSDGTVARIVETKHPEAVDPAELAIREINTGTYAFAAGPLAAALTRLNNDNVAGEYFLPDVLPLMRGDGLVIAAHKSDDPAVNLGVNSRADLAVVEAEARRRINLEHLENGVTIVDPASTWIDVDVEIEADARIEPGTCLRGATKVAAGAVVGPQSTVTDSEIGPDARVIHSFLVEAKVGEGCSVGPFGYLRPGAVMESGSKVGTFVELKNTRLGSGAKVPHLSYVGDAEIGEGANLGAGTITANYDGFVKSRTSVGEGARVGVHTALVAPVNVGAGAYTGAGSVIRKNVPAGSLAINPIEQRAIEGYADRKAAQAERDKAKSGSNSEHSEGNKQ